MRADTRERMISIMARAGLVAILFFSPVPRVRALPPDANLGLEPAPHPTLVTFVSSILRFLLPAASAVLTNEL